MTSSQKLDWTWANYMSKLITCYRNTEIGFQNRMTPIQLIPNPKRAHPTSEVRSPLFVSDCLPWAISQRIKIIESTSSGYSSERDETSYRYVKCQWSCNLVQAITGICYKLPWCSAKAGTDHVSDCSGPESHPVLSALLATLMLQLAMSLTLNLHLGLPLSALSE